MNILTGFMELDNIMGGLKPGELTVIAGRPSMGKTTLCWSIADKINQSEKTVRIVAIKHGYIGTANLFGIDTYSAVLPHAFEYPVNINPRTDKKYDVIFYTALLPASSNENLYIYANLKKLAVEKNISIVVEAEVDRKVERLENRRPKIEHIKYSATIDKYADNIMIVYRDSYYNAQADKTIFEINIAKSSSGRCGTAILKFEIDEIQTTICLPRIKEQTSTESAQY